MSYGLAGEAAERHPDLKSWYGEECKKHQHTRRMPVLSRRFLGPRGGRNLILLPVLGIDLSCPELTWQQPVSIVAVEDSLKTLAGFKPFDQFGKVYVPLLMHKDFGYEIKRQIWEKMRDMLDASRFWPVFASKRQYRELMR
jgi:hypothetical protein